MATIIDTADLSEGTDEDEGFQSDLSATVESSADEKIEFFVQMRSWTQREMEAFIVEAAARHIVGKYNDSKLAKEIESRCIELTSQKADARLSAVTTEIMDQPMIPSFGSSKEPVTMRDFLGLCGREYLAARVSKHNGSPTTDGYSAVTRMEYLVSAALDTKFKREIEAVTNAAISEIQKAVKASHEAFITAEKGRLRAALDAIAPATLAHDGGM